MEVSLEQGRQSPLLPNNRMLSSIFKTLKINADFGHESSKAYSYEPKEMGDSLDHLFAIKLLRRAKSVVVRGS